MKARAEEADTRAERADRAAGDAKRARLELAAEAQELEALLAEAERERQEVRCYPWHLGILQDQVAGSKSWTQLASYLV